MDRNYLNKVLKLKTLDAETERNLIIQYRRHNTKYAKQTLLDHFMKLIVKTAKNVYKSTGNEPGNSLEDLIADGVLGFLVALDKFDINKLSDFSKEPIRLSTYATFWINVYIKGNALNRKSSVYKFGSGKLKGVYFKLPRIMEEKGWRSPINVDQAKEVADIIGHSVTVEEVMIIDHIRTHGEVRLDAHVSDTAISYQERLIDIRPNPEENVERTDLVNWLLKEIERCYYNGDTREKEILLRINFTDRSEAIDELSKKYGLSKTRISQIEQDAAKKFVKLVKIRASQQQ